MIMGDNLRYATRPRLSSPRRLHNGAFATPICRNWTNMSNHRAIIQAFYVEIWNKHDKSQIPALLHEDFAFRGSLGQEQHGHAGFAAYVDFAQFLAVCRRSKVVSMGTRKPRRGSRLCRR